MDYKRIANEIYTYGKMGSDKVYDYLSDSSKEELKEFDKERVVKSINLFFCNKIHLEYNYKFSDDNNVQVFFKNLKVNYDEVVNLRKENNEWKLLWNKKCLEKYS